MSNLTCAELTEQVNRLKISIKEKEEEITELKDRNINNRNTQSDTARYGQFMLESKRLDQIDLHRIGLDTTLESKKLIELWGNICSQYSLLGDGSNEKEQVHPFVDECLKLILLEFGGSPPMLRKYHHPTLQDSDKIKVPDFAISASRILKPAWLDCLGLIECKRIEVVACSNFHEGGGQAIEYGRIAHEAISNSGSQSMRFSAVTDGKAIQFFIFLGENADSIKAVHSGILEFVPGIRAECTEGVKLLCQLIQIIKSQALLLPSTMKIGETEYQTISHLQQNVSISSVCMIDGFEGSTCVVKFSPDKSKHNYFLMREYSIYKSLASSPVRLLKLHTSSNPQMLLFQESGPTLKVWSAGILFPEGKESSIYEKRVFVSVMKGVLDEIVKLHRFGFTHGDIRPSNVLILNQTEVCLIDFAFSNRLETQLESIFGATMYTASRLVNKNSESPFLFLRIHDLESFLITFLDCVAPNLFELIIESYKSAGVPHSEDISIYAVSEDFIRYRDGFILKLLSTYRGKQAQDTTQYHLELLDMFSDLFEVIDGQKLKGDAGIDSVYEKLGKILTYSPK